MFILTADQEVPVSIAFVDRFGNPATVDDLPVWDVSDPAVLDLEVAEDGMSAIVIPVGLGTAQVNVVADADLGEGVIELAAFETIQVVGGRAVGMTFTFGTPTDIEIVDVSDVSDVEEPVVTE